jgi:hypothetical protein
MPHARSRDILIGGGFTMKEMLLAKAARHELTVHELRALAFLEFAERFTETPERDTIPGVQKLRPSYLPTLRP